MTNKSKSAWWWIGFGLAGVGLLLFLLIFVIAPFMVEATSGGLGLKTAAVIAFGVTLATLIILAVAAGDGLLGEIQYMIPAFGTFFVVFWLMIAWIF